MRTPPTILFKIRGMLIFFMVALVISGAVLNCGPFVRFSPLLMGPILRVQPDPNVVSQVKPGIIRAG